MGGTTRKKKTTKHNCYCHEAAKHVSDTCKWCSNGKLSTGFPLLYKNNIPHFFQVKLLTFQVSFLRLYSNYALPPSQYFPNLFFDCITFYRLMFKFTFVEHCWSNSMLYPNLVVKNEKLIFSWLFSCVWEPWFDSKWRIVTY